MPFNDYTYDPLQKPAPIEVSKDAYGIMEMVNTLIDSIKTLENTTIENQKIITAKLEHLRSSL